MLSPEFFNLPVGIEVVSGFSLLPAAISHMHLLPVGFSDLSHRGPERLRLLRDSWVEKRIPQKVGHPVRG